MPPLVHETVAWLRFYTCLPILQLPGEGADAAAPDPALTAQAVPIAGAIVGAFGALVLIVAWAANLPALIVALLVIAALTILTGGLSERALAVAAERLGGPAAPEGSKVRAGTDLVSYGAIALVLAVLARTGVVVGLIGLGIVTAALAFIVAAALARATAISYILTHPIERPEGETATPIVNTSALQRLAVVTLIIAAAIMLPAFGVAPAVAGLAAAVGAAAVVIGVVSRFAGANRREVAGAAEQVAEIAFLAAVLVFARM